MEPEWVVERRWHRMLRATGRILVQRMGSPCPAAASRRPSGQRTTGPRFEAGARGTPGGEGEQALPKIRPD